MLLVLGAGSSIPGLIAYTFSAFVLATIALEFVRGTRARRALSSESWPAAFASLIGRNRRRYGGYVVHVAIVLLAIGIAGSSAYDSVVEGKLARGPVARRRRLHGDLPAPDRARDGRTPPRCGRTCSCSRSGESLGTLEAGKNAYKIAGPIRRSRPRSGSAPTTSPARISS